MSIENGIFIHQFNSKKWGVTEAASSAAEDIKYIKYHFTYHFRNAKYFETRTQALEYALELQKILQTDYGIEEI